mmetsp:Transcript_4297/g.12602  ORF Transcript_4297/g.12602 Transcript_4297/m.12602 type:complete len:268 (+) Transcript_4297:825-1628(+)
MRMQPSYMASSLTSLSSRLWSLDSTRRDPRRTILYLTSSSCISSWILRLTISVLLDFPHSSNEVCLCRPPPAPPEPCSREPPMSPYCASTGSRSFSMISVTTWIHRPSPPTSWGDLWGLICRSRMTSVALIMMMSSAEPEKTPQMMGLSPMFSKMVLLNLLYLERVDSKAKLFIQARSMVFCLIKLIFSATSSRSLSLPAFLPPVMSTAFLFFARSILLLSRLRTCLWWHTLQNVWTTRSLPPFSSLSVNPAKFFHRWHCVHHLRKT